MILMETIATPTKEPRRVLRTGLGVNDDIYIFNHDLRSKPETPETWPRRSTKALDKTLENQDSTQHLETGYPPLETCHESPARSLRPKVLFMAEYAMQPDIPRSFEAMQTLSRVPPSWQPPRKITHARTDCVALPVERVLSLTA